LLVDDIKGVDSLAFKMLEQRIDAALAKLQLESRTAQSTSVGAGTPALRVRALRCSARQPEGRTSFTPALVRELAYNGVVLEVWAETQALPAGQGQGHRAIVGYALVPLRYHFPNAIQGIVMVERTVKSIDTTEDLLGLLDQSGSLAIYTAVGSGLHYFDNEDYDQARTQLCLAMSRLNQIRNATPDEADMLQFVRDTAQQVVRQALSDPKYRGALRVGSPGPCMVDPL
jgi:hypothetical protein